jgi:hypothetical protein
MAIVYWLGVTLAWASGQGGLAALRRPVSWLDHRAAGAQAVVVIAGLVVVAGSAAVVRWLSLPALRLIEGYWPRIFQPIRARLLRRKLRKLEGLEARWAAMADRSGRNPERPASSAGSDLQASLDAAEFIALDNELRWWPAKKSQCMPTRAGNILRAGESRVADKYGLDLIKCWPQLWLLLPDDARAEIATTQTNMQGAVAGAIWGALFVPWTALAWWATPVGAAVGLLSWLWWIPERARLFTSLLEGAIDLYRLRLYDQLRWPSPPTPLNEHETGAALTDYLWAGSDSPTPIFRESSPEHGA